MKNVKSIFTPKVLIVHGALILLIVLAALNNNALFGGFNYIAQTTKEVTISGTAAANAGKVFTVVTPAKWVHNGEGNPFITGFLMLKSWKTLALATLMVVAMFWTFVTGKKTGSFTKMIFTGLGFAVLVGVIGGIATEWTGARTFYYLSAANTSTGALTYTTTTIWGEKLLNGAVVGTVANAQWLGDFYGWAGQFSGAWVRTLQFLVVPTVFFSIITMMLRFGKEKTTKSYFIKGFLYLTIGAGLASVTATLVALPFQSWLKSLPFGQGAGSATSSSNIQTIIAGFFPSNLASAFTNANDLIVPIILLAMAIGGFAVKMSAWGADYEKATHTLENGVKALDKVFKTLLDYTIGLLPLAIIALLSRAIVRFGNVELLKSLAAYLVMVFAGLIAFYILTTLIASVLTGVNPIKIVKRGGKAVSTGFFTQSSLGTLPVSIKTAQEAGISEKAAEVIPTMSTTMGAWGCAGVYPTMVVMALAASGAIELTPSLIIMTVIVTMFASIGIAGVPGVAGIAVAIVLGGIGQGSHYPLYLALLYPLGTLIDMGRTALNVHAGQVTAAIIDKQAGSLDMNKYNA